MTSVKGLSFGLVREGVNFDKNYFGEGNKRHRFPLRHHKIVECYSVGPSPPVSYLLLKCTIHSYGKKNKRGNFVTINRTRHKVYPLSKRPSVIHREVPSEKDSV